MAIGIYNLWLADDDMDDCLFFREALTDLPLKSKLTTAPDGVELMKLLFNTKQLPDILFLDMNMPRKTGYECLQEIKSNPAFNKMPVIIFSTSLDPNILSKLYDAGALFCIRKPGEFSKLKTVIQKAILLSTRVSSEKPSKENFILTTL